jgi:EmrB/QacA subfamily drug resistance transporter
MNNAASPSQVLAVLLVGVLMAALDIGIVGPALPAIQADFGADERALSWVFGIYILFQLIGAPVMAKLSDRSGRRTVYIACVSVFAASSLIVVLAPNLGVMLVGRAIQGFCAGGILPVASAVIGDTFPPEKRGRALGFIGAVFGIAFLLGPLLGGILLRWGWQFLFLLNLPIAAIVLWRSWRILPVSRQRETLPLDVQGILLLSVTLGATALGISSLDVSDFATSIASPRVLPLFVAAILGGIFLRVAQRRAEDPVLHPDLLGSRELRRVGTIALATGMAEASMIFLPTFAVAALGVVESTASFMMVPLVIAITVGSPAAGRLSDRFGPKVVIQTGLVATVIGLLTFGLSTVTVASFLAAGVLVGFGMSALIAPLRFVVIREVSAAQRGAGQGLLVTCLGIGRLTGSAMVGGVAASSADQASGYQNALLFAALLLLAAALVSTALKSRDRIEPVDT